MLCIVNSRAHARALFESIRDLPGGVYLTTLMCPRHRRIELARLRKLLAETDQPVRLVATSLLEAGVDIDFPEVWRAAAGLDSIAQSAGRCNREGRPELGRVVVFEPAEAKPPRALAVFTQAAEAVMRGHADPLTLQAVRDYFAQLYWQKGGDALDAAKIKGVAGIIRAIEERAASLDFPFESIANAFRMIDEAMVSVIVPWAFDAEDTEAKTLLARVGGMERPRSADLRRLQQYMVPVPRRQRDFWLAAGALFPANMHLGNALLRFEDMSHYDPSTGLRIDQQAYRTAEENVW
jgi:CRISPR-associated endonuclease/helicase Cas3